MLGSFPNALGKSGCGVAAVHVAVAVKFMSEVEKTPWLLAHALTAAQRFGLQRAAEKIKLAAALVKETDHQEKERDINIEKTQRCNTSSTDHGISE